MPRASRSTHAAALICVLTAATLASTPRAEASPPSGPTLPPLLGQGPALLPILSDGAARALPEIRLLSEDESGVLFDFALPALAAEAIEIEGTLYHLLALEGGGFTGVAGQPMLPVFSRLIRIPDRSGVRVTAAVLESREIGPVRPLPLQPEDAEAFVIDAGAYGRSGYGPDAWAEVGAPALVRDLRVVPLILRPVRYDPSRETIEVAGRIRVRVDFIGEDPRNARLTPASRPAPSFDRLYGELLVNGASPREAEGPRGRGALRGGQVRPLGCYVLICPDNSQVVAALQPLIEWRRRRGFEVHLATTAETGATKEEIQAWLRNAYETWPHPPEFIALVGDASGSIAIPCWYETYSGYNGETDHPYAQLSGDDILADAHVGRISVDTVERLTLYVNKIVGYESAPYMADTSWFTRACLVGDPSQSGYSCIQIMQWHKQRLLERGYTDVDTIFSSPWVSQMVAALNQGDTVFSYRGYIGMSGFDTGHIASLTNGWKMPYAVNITCATGNFASATARSEAWIRAGTPPSLPNGGIASIGATTSHTDTRHNNCFTYGIWRGAFWEDLHRFGESHTRGKLELFVNYAVHDYNRMCSFTCWINLMGDPAGELWTGVPQALEVTHPGSISIGASAVTVAVEAGGLPCPGAYVCLWKGEETFTGGWTDEDGTIELPVRALTAGEMKVTVTRHDHLPHQGLILVGQQGSFVGYLAHLIDDDASGTSLGNGNQQANPTERIELPVQVRNFGLQSATAVTGTLTVHDPYVSILDGSEDFGTLAPGATAWSADDFDLRIDGGAPHGREVYLDLDLTSGAGTWRSVIPLTLVSSDLRCAGYTLYGAGDLLDPGETGEIVLSLVNEGGLAAGSVTGTLRVDDPWVTLVDSLGAFGEIGIGATGDNGADRFVVRAEEACFPGHQANLTLVLSFSGGMSDTTALLLPVGEAASTDPTGPDAYGYYAFDNTDTGYPEYAPSYAWIEIDPAHGGAGTSVGLTDFGDAQDDSRTIDLPFPFTCYGQYFTRATVCSNGWIAMGSTYLTNYRNWNIPAAGAPDFLIAPMWDDLYQSGTNQVYTLHDTLNHRFIVQWSRLTNNNGGATENFEVILYDPAYHATDTGDGMIVFQYDQFTNCDGLQHYCTVGIQNGDQTDGVEYTYYNGYGPGAATVQSGRAIRFMPLSDLPRGTLAGSVRNASDGGAPLAAAQIHIVPAGVTLVSGPDGTYSGLVPVGLYTVTASHPSFTSQAYANVPIEEGETTVREFSLQDIAPPMISGTTDYGHTIDSIGPYAITSTITDYSTIVEAELIYNAGGAGWISVPLADQGDDLWAAGIPGQPVGTLVRYYARATDAAGLERTDPPDAPSETYAFWVLEPLYLYTMESGPGGWTHSVITEGYVDQWHLGSQRNHTPGGSSAWKCGDAGDGDYAGLADGALASGALPVDGEITLVFWHWIEAEVSGYYAGYAYDGGLIEISIDGGPWTQVTPEGGYPYRIRVGSQPGPFPAETPVFSGAHDWEQVRCELGELHGTLEIRFRFGSDGAVAAEGWHIDDVALMDVGALAPAMTPVSEPPERLALRLQRPNPCGAAGSSLSLDLPRESTVRLTLHDAVGRRVRILHAGDLTAGQHIIAWDGRDERGRPAASGVYFATVTVAGERAMQRLVLVR